MKQTVNKTLHISVSPGLYFFFALLILLIPFRCVLAAFVSVVVHELCHRLEMNHSTRFWEQVECVIPDYKKSRKWLKEHGGRLMLRMRGD